MEKLISAVVLTKNEEKQITDCLKSVSWCDEIIVIDDNSSDETVEIAKAFGAQVFVRPLENDFSRQRNFGQSKARGDWILFIDADERISDKLKKEITEKINDQRLTTDDQINGYYIQRKDFLFGRWLKYGETGKIRLLRLARKGRGIWTRKVHEVWEVEGKKSCLENPILHYPHQKIKQFLKEINFYSTLNAHVFLEQGVHPGLSQVVLYPLGKFFQNYFLRLGFLDGMPGFLQAVFMSFHSFLTRAKLWLLDGN